MKNKPDEKASTKIKFQITLILVAFAIYSRQFLSTKKCCNFTNRNKKRLDIKLSRYHTDKWLYPLLITLISAQKSKCLSFYHLEGSWDLKEIACVQAQGNGFRASVLLSHLLYKLLLSRSCEIQGHIHLFKNDNWTLLNIGLKMESRTDPFSALLKQKPWLGDGRQD